GFDADLREVLGITDTGELQKVRRGHRAGRQDHLALSENPLNPAMPRKIDADRALAVEHDAAHQRVRDELQIGTLQGRSQVAPGGARRAPPAAGPPGPPAPAAGP